MRRKDRKFGQVPERTRKNMQKIRSKDTSIEVLLRKRLWHAGYRYRKNYKRLPGSPDIAVTKNKIAIFCDSEFFHGKDWEHLKARLQRGKNPQYWIRHIEENMERDQRIEKELGLLDWTVVLGLNAKEREQMLDLAGRERNQVSPDLPGYIMDESLPNARTALRKAKDQCLGDDFWQEVNEIIDKRSGTK